MKKIYLVILVCPLIFLIFGCWRPQPHLTIQNHQWTKEYSEFLDWWTAEVTGIAINDGNVNLSYAEVNVKFYDINNNVLDSGLDNILNLGVGETWYFSEIYWDDPEPDYYEIEVGDLYY